MVTERLDPGDSVILDPLFYTWTPGFYTWAPGLPLPGDYDPTLEVASLEVFSMDMGSPPPVLTGSTLETVVRKASLQDVGSPSSVISGFTLATVLLVDSLLSPFVGTVVGSHCTWLYQLSLIWKLRRLYGLSKRGQTTRMTLATLRTLWTH
jgi:hypothetical protein